MSYRIIERPVNPPDECDTCPDCGCPSHRGRVCRECRDEYNADNDD